MRILLVVFLAGMYVLAMFFLRRRPLTLGQYLWWGTFALLVPALGPFLVILSRPGGPRRRRARSKPEGGSMKQDKFLIGILAFIGLLVVAALALFFVRGQAEPMTDDTPEGVVYNYILALQEEDYERAYSYLADQYRKPTLTAFEYHFTNQYYDNLSAYAVDIEETRINGNTARVDIIVTRVATDPFSDSWSSTDTATLIRQGGEWKIKSMPYQFWGWNWYQ